MAWRYRDRLTGKFISRKKFERYKSRGGKRFKREKSKPKQKEREITPAPPPPKEWIASADYSGRVRANAIRIQMHIHAPANATKKEVLFAAHMWAETNDVPEG